MAFTDFCFKRFELQRVGSNKRWNEQEMENAFLFTSLFTNDFVLLAQKGSEFLKFPFS